MTVDAGVARRDDSWPDLDEGRPGAWLVPPDPDCSIGSHLFDPRHGIVVVQSVESRERGGRVTEYLTLRAVDQPLTLLVPRATVGAGALRRVMTREEASAVLDELGREPQPLPPWTSLGYLDIQRRMLGRNPLTVAGIVRDLAIKARGSGRGITERTLLVRGTALLAAEIGVALQITAEQARSLMDGVMTAGLVDPGAHLPARAQGSAARSRSAETDVLPPRSRPAPRWHSRKNG